MFHLAYKKNFSPNNAHSSLWLKFTKDAIFLADEFSLCEYKHGQLIPIHQFSENFQLLHIADGTLHIHLFGSKKSFLWYYKTQRDTLIPTDFQCYKESLNSTLGAFFIDYDDLSGDDGIYNFETNTLLFKGNLNRGKSYFVLGEKIVLDIDYRSHALDRYAHDGIKIWSCPLPRRNFWGNSHGPDRLINDKIEKIIGLYNGLIWIATLSGSIYAINAETGRIKHDIKNPDQDKVRKIWIEKFVDGKRPYTIKDSPTFTKSTNFETSELDQTNNLMIGLNHFRYWEFKLDAPKRTLRLVDMQEFFRQKDYWGLGFVSNSLPFDEKYMYTCESYKGIVLAINRKTLKIDWSYQIDLERQGMLRTILTMYYHNNQLFIVDRENTLYIFEKTAQEQDNSQSFYTKLRKWFN